MRSFSNRTLSLRTQYTLSYITFVLFCLYCDYANADSQQKQRLRIGYAEFAPIEYTDPQGKPAGSFIEITKKILEETGTEAEFISLPLARLYLYLINGDIDMWPGLKGVPSLAEHTIESDSVPTRIQLASWHLNTLPPIKKLDDMKGSRLILINGYTYGGLLAKFTAKDSGFVTLFTATHSSGLQMMEKNRGDYLLDYLEPITETLKSHPIENLQYTILHDREGAFVFSKKNPSAKRLQEMVDNTYYALVKRGEIARIGLSSQ